MSGRLARNTGWSFAQQVWLAVLGFVGTPILFHTLGDTQYGLLAVVSLATTLIASFEFGVLSATVWRVADADARDDTAAMGASVSVALGAVTILGLVGSLVLFAGAGVLVTQVFDVPAPLRPLGVDALRIGVIILIATLLASVASSVWQGLQRFAVLSTLGALGGTVQIVGGIILALLGFDARWIVLWSGLTASGLVAAHLVGLRRTRPSALVLRVPGRALVGAMLRFGGPLWVAGLLTQASLAGGSLLVGVFVPIAALPFFTVSFGVFQTLNRMAYGLSTALYPMVAHLDAAGDEGTLDRVLVSGSRILALLGMALMVPAILLAEPFLTAWMGADFSAEAAKVLQLLFAAFALSLPAVPAIELARGTGRPRYLVWYAGALAVVYLGGIALLAPRAGVTGAAIAFLGSQVVTTPAIVLLVGRSRVGRIFSPAFVATWLGGIGLAVAALTTPPGLVPRTALAVASFVALVAVSYLWVLRPEERRTLLDSVRA